jgi:hypothetical protein
MHWPKPHRNGDFGYSIGVSTYPDIWKDLATACKQRAGWRCEECGSTERLGAAHVNHDPENPNPELRCLCWPCHRSYDAHTGNAHTGKNARRKATRKKNREKQRAGSVRMRYLTLLWLIGYLPYLHKLLALEQELTKISIRLESAIERARRISREVQSGEGRFELDMRLVRIPGTRM